MKQGGWLVSDHMETDDVILDISGLTRVHVPVIEQLFPVLCELDTKDVYILAAVPASARGQLSRGATADGGDAVV